MCDGVTKLEFRNEVCDFLQKEWCNDELVKINGREACASRFDALLRTLTTPPMVTTLRLNTRAASRQDITQQLQPILSQQYTQKGKPPPELRCHPHIEDAMVITNYGPHQVDKLSTEVMVGLVCGMAVLRGADIYAQGIVGAPSYMNAGDCVSVYADLDGTICKGLTKVFHGPKLFVGNGIAEMSRAQLFCSGNAKPSGLAIRMVEPLYTAPSLFGVLPSLIFPQNLPSIVCSHILDPQPGETILDMCAAPGGKTVHIATLMKDQGVVIALDKSKNKISRIEENVTSWGLKSIKAFAFDGTKAVSSEVLDAGDMRECPPYSAGTFDRVLLDAPCSALGQRPAIRNTLKLTEVTSYGPLQRKLFSAAVELLKPGGTLVYSTCTITLDENEGLVSWALETFPCLQLQKQNPHLGSAGMPGSGLPEHQLALLQRFDPSAPPSGTAIRTDTDTIGFFCAKFLKYR